MSELINIFWKFGEMYKDNKLLWTQLADLYDKFNDAKRKADADTSESFNEICSIPFIKCALKNPHESISTMMELCTTIRGLCGSESRTTYYETHDCWKEILKAASRDSYLAYIYGLAGLATLDASNSNHTKLALAAVTTYLLSLTIPGAKGFSIFDEDIITHCFTVFTLAERIQNPEILSRMSKQQPVEIWVHLSTLCDDLKLLLRYVHFKDYKSVRNNMLKTLINVLHLNHERGYANMYAANLHTNCFEIFDELINAHNGDPEETLTKLMNMTVFLHVYAPKPKHAGGSAFAYNTAGTNCEHISDWFINSIAKYPRLLTKVLRLYIECTVTNPVKSWKTEQIQRALEYAAKYDAALFTKSNESCVEFLCDAIYADEVMIRTRCVELISRILQIESKVDWQMFRHEVSDIPREVHLIKELIDSLRDTNNTMKLRAVQALQIALTKGSPNAQKIMTEGVRFARFHDAGVVLPVEPRVRKNEIRYEKPTAPTPAYTFEGHGLVELSFLHLPEYVYDYLFESSISNIRRAGISFIENLISVNPLIIFETKFAARMMNFIHEPTALVRKQAMLTIDALLNQFPCYPVIWVWCKIIAPLLNDADPKNTELAINCFQSRVLLNIKPLEQSDKAEHFMPWVIIRTMLSTESRLYLQTCFHLSLKQSLVNRKMLSIIESHLLTCYSTEAWIVLNFISGKIKSEEPDNLINKFISLPSWNKEQNMLIAIEVLANCIEHFSHTALNYAANHILNGIRSGEMLPVLTGKAFDFLKLIDQQSQQQSKKRSSALSEISWIEELHEHLEKSIIQGIAEFPHNLSTLMSHLYSYSEVNVQTRIRPKATIIAFIHKYMSECLKLQEVDLDLENERLFNSMIIISGRFSLRDANVASNTCNLYDNILRTMDHPPIVNTIIVAITDICKKHTQIVERIIERVLSKLQSPYFINRMETFKCFEKLVLQDQLKLRDTLLLSLLLTILDDNDEMATRASYFFKEYTTKKNTTLFHRCLMEYPFVLNEYKNFVCKDSFSNKCISSPLKDDALRKKRQILYNYFMSEMDEISLILYFNQLKLIAEKTKSDPLMKTSSGVAVLKDVLFILKRVCQLTKEKNSAVENKDDGEQEKTNEEAELEELNNPAPSAANAEAANTSANAAANKRGRRRRDIATMEDALNALEKSLIFVPAIYKAMLPIDGTLEKYFNVFCRILATRFPSYVSDAQPADFWKKYKKVIQAIKAEKTRARKRKTTAKVDEEDDADETDRETEDAEAEKSHTAVENSDTASDSDDLPLICRQKQPSPSKRLRFQGPATLMEYVFHPNI